MSDEIPAKPLPSPTPVSAQFWEGTRNGRLMLQRCTGCGALRHYPQPLCASCQSPEIDWVPASGHGTVHSWTICFHPYHPAFKGEMPYVLLTVDLEEGVRQMGRFEAADAARLKLGAQVSLHFVPTENGYGLPAFVLAERD